MIKKLFIFSLLLVAGLSLSAKKAEADYIYGETEISRKILVDKKLKPVSWTSWYDNLSLNEYAFSGNELIDFKVIVKNTGSNDLQEIKIVDYLPGSVNYIFGGQSFDEDNHQINWEIDSLSPNEEKEFKFRGQVIKPDELPISGSLPVINRVRAESNTGEADEDTAEFYLQAEAKELPEAGINLALGTILGLGTASFGLLARKFGRGEILS
ncbi:MAG: hypothetical protein ABIB61_01835 [Candidatus Shapirobacteria bacterium]